MRPGDLLAGCAYILLTLICLPTHLTILWIFARKDEFRKFMAFRIMIQMGLLECVLVIFGSFFAGLMTLSQSNFNAHFDRIAAAFVASTWIGITAFSLLLAINRFLVFTNIKMSKRCESWFYNLFSLTAWIAVIAMFSVHASPVARAFYNFKYNMYEYEQTPLAQTLEIIEFYTVTSTMAVTFTLCVATFIAIVIQRSGFANKVNVASGELKLLIQSVIIFVYLLVIRIGWHIAKDTFSTDLQFTALGLFGESVAGLNPALYLIFNRKLRQYVLQAWKLKRKVNSVLNVHIGPAAIDSGNAFPTYLLN